MSVSGIFSGSSYASYETVRKAEQKNKAVQSEDSRFYETVGSSGNNYKEWKVTCSTMGKTSTLCQGALFSGANPNTGEWVNVFYADNYSEDNPLYIVKGTDADGKQYEKCIDAGAVNPRACSFVELAVYNEYMGTDSPADFLTMAVMKSEAGEPGIFEKKDWIKTAKKLTEDMKKMGSWGDFLRYSQWVQMAEGKYGQSERVIQSRMSGERMAPYSLMADENGVITYNGVSFICDNENHQICLGDMSNDEDVMNIYLSDGVTLRVNRDNIDDLGKAIGMFSPENIGRILRAIEQDKQCRSKLNEIEEMVSKIGKEI